MVKLVKPEMKIEEGAEEGTILEGQWFWVKEKENKEPWFGCCTHLGSNYAQLTNWWGGSVRIAFEDFWKVCTFEPDHQAVLDDALNRTRGQLRELMGEVEEITKRLGLGEQGPDPGTTGLAISDVKHVDAYKKALAKARQKDLPELFSQIEKKNKKLVALAKARFLSFRTEHTSQRKLLERVDAQIANVELYAGLVESIKLVKKGKPAPADSKLHLLQRMCFMDEECLVNYEAGGMRFDKIEEFDRWLCRAENFERLLPFPRCIVAFRVRRASVPKEYLRARDFLRFLFKDEDKETFLYIRNGTKLYRLSTDLKFPEKLFPDLDRLDLGRVKLWAHMSYGSIKGIINDGDVVAALEKKRRLEAERDALPPNERWKRSVYESDYHYEPFDPSSLYYDDIKEKIEQDVREHNRIALVIQGILDRSEVLHPHPPMRIWTAEGFTQHVVLIYDQDRALVSGPAPDFEAYRAGLNATLAKGCFTVGQQDAWLRVEAEKENDRHSYNERHYDHTWYKPYGNDGPGLVAEVVHMSRDRQCTFRWERDRSHPKWDSWKGEWDESGVPCKFACGADKLLNVSAYTPGDFKQFFADPRTRADYLQWAQMLLAAEDWHAKNKT